ncbi:MFS transporter [Gordonibacter sp. 28C]|uniref:MFS transporter n=1 Tax=Gordonibacter sp. 28C TaxID=2078569 RepID=UPI001314D398|nr:MFS transporter [Gordonibacter sp. 28C]
MNHRMRYLATGVLSLLFLGLIYSWSNFSAPIGEEFGWDRESMRFVFTLSIIAFCFGGYFGARLNGRFSFRPTMLIAGVLLVGGFASTALVLDAGGLPALYVTYGVLCGGGCGIAYNVIIATVNAWFPERVGFSSGALMMGFGLGGLVLGTAAAAGIDLAGWRTVFLVLAALIAIVLGVTALVIKPAPMLASGSSNVAGSAEGSSEHAAAGKALGASHETPMVRTPLFWVYSVWATCAICAGLMIIGDAKPAALAVGLEAGFATLLVGLVSTTNGVARIVIGVVFDRFGLRAVMASASLAALLGAVALAWSFAPGTRVPGLFVAGALLVGFSYGCVPVIASAFARSQFGQKHYAENLALANFNMASAALLSSFAAGGARALGGADNGDFAVYAAVTLIVVVALVGFAAFFRLLRRNEARAAEQGR